MPRIFKNLTFQVLVAVSLGVLLGVEAPATAKSLKPIGDTFINLVKMVITPIIFLTIVHGIASMAGAGRSATRATAMARATAIGDSGLARPRRASAARPGRPEAPLLSGVRRGGAWTSPAAGAWAVHVSSGRR